MSPHLHRAYGLCVESPLPLNDLPPWEGPPPEDAVQVRIQEPEMPLLEHCKGWHRESAERAGFSHVEFGSMLCVEGKRVEVVPHPESTDELLRTWIQGPAMALILEQRGWLVLHASAVRVGEEAVAFAGASGAGKSTLVTALVKEGHLLISDDVCPVVEAGEGVQLHAGLPRIKLWPDAVARVGVEGERLRPLNEFIEKQVMDLRDRFHGEALPLRALYVLEQGEETAIEALRPMDGLLELLTHTYGAIYLGLAAPAEHLQQSAGLLRRVPLHRLQVNRQAQSVAELVHTVLQHLGERG